MPIMVLTSEASYHAPYDHCTVKFLQQAGVKPSFIRLADSASRATATCMMQEKNNKEIAAVIASGSTRRSRSSGWPRHVPPL